VAVVQRLEWGSDTHPRRARVQADLADDDGHQRQC